MKKIINIIKYGLLSFLFLFNFSCNEQNFLEEVPLDFFSPENSYQTMTNFESSLTDLYARVRRIHYGGTGEQHFAYLTSTDIAKHARGDAGRFGSHTVWLDPTNWIINYHWDNWYKIISNANTMISRIEDSELTEEQKKLVAAEAKLFRAFAYRYLVYLWGGVPMILDEITEPKTDFTRASKEEILNQI
ncbi:MAG: RagB/SusD family nutrient uptake outer membrane protein, partial [Bacteroidota bacterium]